MTKQDIQKDLKQALKKGERLKVSTLRMLLSALNNKEKEKQEELNENEIVEVVSAEVKNRREAIEKFEEGGRKEKAEQEKQEMKILKDYLPEQLSDEEIKELVEETVEQVGAEGMQDMGEVMGKVMPEVKGKASGDKVNRIVKEKLS